MENNVNLDTYFASAYRSSPSQIAREAKEIMEAPHISQVLNSLPDVVAILNFNRQIIFTNKTLLALLNLDNPMKVLGLRPGEALACVNSRNHDENLCCGTTEACAQCGAVSAIVNSNIFNDEIRECRIMNICGTCFELLVTTRVININNKDYTMFIAKNIADEKRRAMLEKLFYHDVSNLAGVIHTMADMLKDAPVADKAEYYDILYGTSKALLEEIQAQKLLNMAEMNELVMKPSETESKVIINEAALIYSNHSTAFNKKIIIDSQSDNVFFLVDKNILRRILGNMLKNALEAENDGGTVTIGSKKENNRLKFYVHNTGYIPTDIGRQIFQHSFSTKGKGRGLGTYSIKLFTEKYLFGKVYFESSDENGTTFFVEIPLNMGTLKNVSVPHES